MKISEVKAILCHGGTRTWTFVKVTTDEGLVGWGDATEWARPAGHRAVVEDLAILLLGENPFDIERLWQKMWVASYVGGKDLSVAMTGIETALWDILGKALNTPVYNLLGGVCHERPFSSNSSSSARRRVYGRSNSGLPSRCNRSNAR